MYIPGPASSFRRSSLFRPPAILGDNTPVVSAVNNVVAATEVLPGGGIPDVSVVNDVPPVDVLTGGSVPDFSAINNNNGVPPADSSITDFGGILRDPVIQGIESGQQPPVTFVEVPTATKPEFNVPEQPTGISSLPIANAVSDQVTGIGPNLVTDIGGRRPQKPIGRHVDMPGEHGNNSSFPVLHIENHGHTTGHASDSQAVTHHHPPSPVENHGPTTGHVPDAHSITHQNEAFPSNLNDLSNRMHIDMPSERLNGRSEPFLHRPEIDTNRPIQNVFNTGLDMRSEARLLDLPTSLENIVSLSETRSSQPILHRPESRVQQGVHIDFPGDHGHTGTEPVVHRPEPRVPQGVHIDFPGDHGHTGTQPVVHRPEPRVPQGVHIDFPGDHGHTGTQPVVHRPEPGVPQGVHIDFPGDHGHTGTQPVVHRPEPRVPQGVHIDFPGDHGHTGTQPVVHRPEPRVPQGVHIDFPGDHGHTGTEPVVHRPEPRVPQGVHIDFPGDHGHTGTEPVVHRPEPRVPQGVHIDFPGDHGHTGSQPVIHRPGPKFPQGLHVDFSGDHGHTGTQPVIHRPEPKVEHGAHKPESRLPTTEHIALQGEKKNLGQQINKPDFNTFDGINIDLSRNHVMDMPLDGHHPKALDTGSLGKHVSLDGVSSVQRPILQLPIDTKELIPLSPSTKHVDLTSKHDGVGFPSVHKKKDHVFHENKLPLVSAVRDLVNKYKSRSPSLPDKSSHVKSGPLIDKHGPHSSLTFPDHHDDMHGTPIKNTFEPVHRATGFIDIQPDFLGVPDVSHKDPAVLKHKRLDKLPGVVAISPGHHIDLPEEHNNKLGVPAIHTKDGRHIPLDPAGHDPVGFPDHKLSGKDKMTDIFRKPVIDPFDRPIVVKPKRKPVKDWRLRGKKYYGRRRGKGGRRRKGRGKFRGWKRVHKPKPTIFPGKGHEHPKKDLEKPKPVVKPVKKPVEKPVNKPVHKDTITIIRIPPRGRPHPLEALRNMARAMLGGFLNRLG